MYKIENIQTARLKEYENNPRNNDIAVEKVAESIKRFGFLFPIVIDLNYVIVCGHTRKKACDLLGIKKVPCIRADDLNPEQIRYFRLVDNRTSEYAEWDFTRLEEELRLIDLECVENYLLLETFELDSNITEFDDDMEDIKVDGFNFMVSSSSNDQSSRDVEDNSNDEQPVIEIKSSPAGGDVQTHNASGGECSTAGSFDVPGSESEKNKPEPQKLLMFEVGKIRFYISKVELDMLNGAYTKYLDTVYPAKSFIDYLLEGCK